MVWDCVSKSMGRLPVYINDKSTFTAKTLTCSKDTSLADASCMHPESMAFSTGDAAHKTPRWAGTVSEVSSPVLHTIMRTSAVLVSPRKRAHISNNSSGTRAFWLSVFECSENNVSNALSTSWIFFCTADFCVKLSDFSSARFTASSVSRPVFRAGITSSVQSSFSNQRQLRQRMQDSGAGKSGEAPCSRANFNRLRRCLVPTSVASTMSE
mmetsp:Transcript_59121/g.129676  ORF Transcript_59121/g.129676 Transcript_59121/m.129676 type:complete len:211 (-) Transcript_59121:262-894(-)